MTDESYKSKEEKKSTIKVGIMEELESLLCSKKINEEKKREPTEHDKMLSELNGLSKLPNFTIINAHKLEMTPEEFEEQKKKNARSLLALTQGNSEVYHRHTNI